jgi:thiamine pyrophosphate-dependent acetolactate synthase large subunit-like protein
MVGGALFISACEKVSGCSDPLVTGSMANAMPHAIGASLGDMGGRVIVLCG